MPATFLTVLDSENLIIERKGNLGGFDSTNFIGWCNYLNQFLYPKFCAINPNHYLLTTYIKTKNGVTRYALPSDYKNINDDGVYYTNYDGNAVPAYASLNYETQTGNFTVGQVVTGATSESFGTIYAIIDYGTTGTLILTGLDGAFENGETITDPITGSAKADDTASPFGQTSRTYAMTGFGDYRTGFWVERDAGGNYFINFTGLPNPVNTIIIRYVPMLPKLVDEDDATIIPSPEYDEFILTAFSVFWELNRDNPMGQMIYGQSYEQALNDMLRTLNSEPLILNMPNRGVSRTTIRRGTYRN